MNRNASPMEWVRVSVELSAFAESLIGVRNWRLLRSYGKLMAGPHSGSYVSGIPFDLARRLVKALAEGAEVHVHLMHRHRSGNYEASRTRFVDGRLEMVFKDRVERAQGGFVPNQERDHQVEVDSDDLEGMRRVLAADATTGLLEALSGRYVSEEELDDLLNVEAPRPEQGGSGLPS